MEEEENLSGASGDNEELDDLQKVGVVGGTNLTYLYSCVYGWLYLPPEGIEQFYHGWYRDQEIKYGGRDLYGLLLPITLRFVCSWVSDMLQRNVHLWKTLEQCTSDPATKHFKHS